MAKLRGIYKCEICGNVVEVLHSGVGELVCCGEEMKEQIEKTEDSSVEKHVPYIEKTIDFLKNNFKVQLYHIPHCKINKKYYRYIVNNTVENKRLLNLKKCKKCVYRKKCSGIWKSYENYSNLK